MKSFTTAAKSAAVFAVIAVMSACTAAPAASPTAAPAAAATAVGTAKPAVTAPKPTDSVVDPLKGRPMAQLSAQERGAIATQQPPVTIDITKKYLATIQTAKGNIIVELDPTAAPQTVNNFIYLASNGFYDGLTFHRVEPGFVIQGGDPAGNGTGGPGYGVPPEIKLKHVDGAIAMARRSGPAASTPSSGSQFYITLGAQPNLDDQYTVFGHVVSGLDVAGKIAIGDKITRIDVVEGSAAAISAAPGGAAKPVVTAGPTAIPLPTATPVPATCSPITDTFAISDPLLNVVKDDHVLGASDKATTLVEYGDLECPACGSLYPVLHGTYTAISDTAKLVFRHYPLTEIHPRAMLGSMALESAGTQGKFWEMMDTLYTKQAEWATIAITDGVKLTDTLKTYAKNLGLDVAKFEAGLSSADNLARIQRDMKSGDALKINSTPSLFIDGRALNPAALANEAFFDQYESYYKARQGYAAYMATNPLRVKGPEQVTDKSAIYQMTLKTSKGDVVLELDPKLAPVNVNSMVFLAQKGYFKNVPLELNDATVGATLFLDPSGTGTASPGYDCSSEAAPAGAFDQAGVVALYGDGERTGSQFVITYTPTQQFEGQFTVIGKVVSGLDTLKNLVPRQNEANAAADKIDSVTVSKK
ncbi:MAG TPA: peptidylprolyl isomerase [Thermoflexales bacterium]|nr:peptidylprolyl isomerase [Thermoflexales bacterium]HQW34130.1 peptidylprolyl isomerase [Thermoflexales bacterium]